MKFHENQESEILQKSLDILLKLPHAEDCHTIAMWVKYDVPDQVSTTKHFSSLSHQDESIWDTAVLGTGPCNCGRDSHITQLKEYLGIE